MTATQQLELSHFEKIQHARESAKSRKPVEIPAAQAAVLDILRCVRGGALELTDPSGTTFRLGNPAEGPTVGLRVHTPEFFKRVLKEASLGLGESYTAGWWDVTEGDLADLFTLLFKGRVDQKAKASLVTKARAFLGRLEHSPRSLKTARADIESHYDLGNEFFAQMLGRTMTYSCGYLMEASDTLDQMQEQKFDRILTKLGITDRGTLLDIGCGWGSLLIHAAKKAPGLHAVGVTLSGEQQRFANERIREEGLADRITIRLMDYRELKGSFDYIVSVGMFEHVGRESYPEFMRQMHDLLTPGGKALLHCIGTEEDPEVMQDAWIDKHIFPGTYLPRLEQIVSEMRTHELAVGHLENWRPHYVETLKRWRDQFVKHWPEIQKLGTQFDKEFFRLWNYYLQFCQACFTDSTVELYQVLMCRREGWAFPMRFNF